MKKIKSITFLLCMAASLIAFSACSKEDNTESSKDVAQAVQFGIVEEDFAADTELTRAAQVTTPALSELNDCETETTVESEPVNNSTAGTRAVTTPVHYTIRAYQNGVVKGEMKGTFSGSTFTPDAGSSDKMELHRKSTYDIVCFNDDVTANGSQLEVSLAKAATARIGRKQVVLGTTDQIVNLSAKHVGIRVRTQILAKKHMPTAITANVVSTADLPLSVSYNPSDGTYTKTNSGAMPAAANNSPASTQEEYKASNYGKTYSYTSDCTDYHYFLPLTDITSLKLTVTGGQIFHKPMSGTLALAQNALQLSPNGNYLVKIKMKPKVIYLFTDGSTGSFKQTVAGGGSNIPVAVVVNQDKHIAVALKDAEGLTSPYYFKRSEWNKNTIVSNSTSFSTAADKQLDTRGYYWTWDKDGSSDHTTIKGDDLTHFPAFYYAGHYSTGETLTNGLENKKWYLPAHGEWVYLYHSLGFGGAIIAEAVGLPYEFRSGVAYAYLIDDAFTQVGGEDMRSKIWYHSSSSSTYWGARWGQVDVFTPKFIFQGNPGTPQNACYTRSFIQYK